MKRKFQAAADDGGKKLRLSEEDQRPAPAPQKPTATGTTPPQKASDAVETVETRDDTSIDETDCSKQKKRIRKLTPARPWPIVTTSVSSTGPRSAHKEGKNLICVSRKTKLGAYMRRCKDVIIKDGYKTLHLSAMGAAIPLLLQLTCALPPILPFARDEIKTEITTQTCEVQDEVLPDDDEEDISIQQRSKSTLRVVITIGDGKFEGDTSGPLRKISKSSSSRNGRQAGKDGGGGKGKAKASEPMVYTEPDQDELMDMFPVSFPPVVFLLPIANVLPLIIANSRRLWLDELGTIILAPHYAALSDKVLAPVHSLIPSKIMSTTTATITETPTPTQPDIGYHPDEAQWKARTARRLAEDPSLLNTPLPAGFPAKASGPIVWEGSDWKNEEQWVYKLSETNLQEVDDALKHFKGLNLGLGYIGKDTFPLPTLSAQLDELARQLYQGRGFFVLRTIPIDKYSREELAIIYAGISSHVGSARGKQDGTGAVLAHIKDLRVTHAHERGGIGNSAYTTDKQVFHTDVGDLIALMALETAAEGGTSRISSGGRVYNELAQTRPDLVKTLSEPWPLDSFGGDPGYTTRPLLYHEDNNIIFQYSRRHFTGYGPQKRSPHIPPITESQAEALDAIHFLAEKYNLGLNFQKGDIQYINSLGLMHARDEFRDSPEKTRHLVRLWLRNDELAWKTPGPLQAIWKRLYSVGPEEQRFPLEPEIRRKESGKTK